MPSKSFLFISLRVLCFNYLLSFDTLLCFLFNCFIFTWVVLVFFKYCGVFCFIGTYSLFHYCVFSSVVVFSVQLLLFSPPGCHRLHFQSQLSHTLFNVFLRCRSRLWVLSEFRLTLTALSCIDCRLSATQFKNN